MTHVGTDPRADVCGVLTVADVAGALLDIVGRVGRLRASRIVVGRGHSEPSAVEIEAEKMERTGSLVSESTAHIPPCPPLVSRTSETPLPRSMSALHLSPQSDR